MALSDPMGDAGWNDGGNAVAYTPSALNQALKPMSTDDLIKRVEAKAYSGDDAALETLFNAYFTADKEKYWNQRNYEREDTYAQRLVQDLQKAGISPYVLSGITPQAGSASFGGVSGSHLTSAQTARLNREKADQDRAQDFTRTILSFLGTALMALAILA